jgi:CCR4-NOT transcription complex subunit 6
MCYNVLCDKYATRQYYGYCPAWALNWEYRKKLILDDIKNFNADVIALQELETEQFYNYFLPELKQFDYDGIFSPKSRAKTMAEQDKKHVDGCAIFFKTSRFALVKDYLIEFNQIAMATAEGSEDMLNRVMTKDNIGLAALLEVKQDGDGAAAASGDSKSPNSAKDQANASPVNKQLLLVSTAHIHWDPDYCDVKLIQTLMFTNEIKLIIEQATREFRSTPSPQPIDCSSTIPVVVCADLNSLPESGVIEYLRTGRILANHVDFKDLGYDSCLQKINTSDKPSELSHNLKLDCAYDKEIMPYTNYTYDFKGMIDYIFYSRNLMRTVGLLGPLDQDWIKSNRIVGFPHPHVPSDHLPLMVELELFNPNMNNSNSMFSNSFNYQSSSSSNVRTNQSQSHHGHHGHHGSSAIGNSLHPNSMANLASAASNNNQLPIGQMIPINSNNSSGNSNTSSNNNFNFLNMRK